MHLKKRILLNALRWPVLTAMILLAGNFTEWSQRLDFTVDSNILPRQDQPLKVSRYLNSYKEDAVAVSESSGIPVAIILATGGLESGWGTSKLAEQANNHFGIKGDPETEEVYWKFTREEQPDGRFVQKRQSFRKYPTVRNCYQDFARHLKSNPRYQRLFRIPPHKFHHWANALQQAGYATDPHYADKLIRIIKEHELYKY